MDKSLDLLAAKLYMKLYPRTNFYSRPNDVQQHIKQALKEFINEDLR